MISLCLLIKFFICSHELESKSFGKDNVTSIIKSDIAAVGNLSNGIDQFRRESYNV